MDEALFDRPLEDQLCFRLYRASNGLGKMYTRALQPFQLTFSQYLVLLALWDKEHVVASEIGKRTGMGIGTLNPILKRLEDHGWIQKTPHESDKRATLISLTDKANSSKSDINRSILEELKECHLEGINLLELMRQLQLLQGQMDIVNRQRE